MRKFVSMGLAVAVATAAPAMAADISITAIKMIILDKLAAASKAKIVFVSKDGAIVKGAGTNPATVDAQTDIYGPGMTAAGSLVMAAGAGVPGWKANNASVAKYVNLDAPAAPGAVKVSVVKAGLLKVVAKSLGDSPVSIAGPASSSLADIRVVHTLNNGGTNRYCTKFDGCVRKEIAGGGNYKVICKGNIAPDTCPTSPSGAFID